MLFFGVQKILFPTGDFHFMGNNSVPKFIFRLSRFPVYRGSVLGRFYCIWLCRNLLTYLIAVLRPDTDVLWRKLRANNSGTFSGAPSVYSLFQNSNIIQASHFKEAVSTTEVTFPPQLTPCVDSAAARYSSVTSELLSLIETSYWTQKVCSMALYSPSLNILWSSCVGLYFMWQLSLLAFALQNIDVKWTMYLLDDASAATCAAVSAVTKRGCYLSHKITPRSYRMTVLMRREIGLVS
jgi:hypothetical protein